MCSKKKDIRIPFGITLFHWIIVSCYPFLFQFLIFSLDTVFTIQLFLQEMDSYQLQSSSFWPTLVLHVDCFYQWSTVLVLSSLVLSFILLFQFNMALNIVSFNENGFNRPAKRFTLWKKTSQVKKWYPVCPRNSLPDDGNTLMSS